MTRRPATIEEGAPLEDAAAMMAEGGFRHLPVLDAEGRLVGMLSERDLRARLGTDVERFVDAAPDALAQTAGSAMTPDPIALGPRSTLGEALEVFADERVGAVPVVDEGERVVGIASYLDLLGFLRAREGVGAPSAPARAKGAAPAPARPRAKVAPPRPAPRRRPAAGRRARRSRAR
jgi:CBS domain-containing protein